MLKDTFKVGDFIRGKYDETCMYTITTHEMTLGQVLKIDTTYNSMLIKVLQHKYTHHIGKELQVSNNSLFFEIVSTQRNFEIGDFIRGSENNDAYGVTNKNMLLGKVMDVYDDRMSIKILEHKESERIGHVYYNIPMCNLFEIISHQTYETFDVSVLYE